VPRMISQGLRRASGVCGASNRTQGPFPCGLAGAQEPPRSSTRLRRSPTRSQFEVRARDVPRHAPVYAVSFAGRDAEPPLPRSSRRRAGSRLAPPFVATSPVSWRERNSPKRPANESAVRQGEESVYVREQIRLLPATCHVSTHGARHCRGEVDEVETAVAQISKVAAIQTAACIFWRRSL
jgi:hypothetical protein